MFRYCFHQQVIQVDLVSCEHTPYSLDKKWQDNQPQTTIGNKQTARLQVTDIRYAKCGKVLQDQLKSTIRAGLREASFRTGKAAQMLARGELKLDLVCQMHAACVEDNQSKNGVVKAFRMGGWLAYRPTPTGFLPLDGPVWNQFPLGSSRIPNQLTGWLIVIIQTKS